MAICFRQPGWQNSATLVTPPGVQDGDLMVAILMADQLGFDDYVGPAGWIKQGTAAVGLLFGENFRASLFTKVASGETGPYVFTNTSSIFGVFGLAIALFDDGGASVEFESFQQNQTANSQSAAAPPITPVDSADPYELIIALWGTEGGVLSPVIGSSIMTTATSGAGWAGIAYPGKLGISVAPVATTVGFGIKNWCALQACFKVTTPSAQRTMLRAIGQTNVSLSTLTRVPDNVVTGDLMVAFARGASAIGTPDGWTQLDSIDSNKYAAYSRTADSEPHGYIFIDATDSSIVVYFSMDDQALHVNTWKLAGPSASEDSYAGPVVTTDVDGKLVICNFADGDYSSLITGPSGPIDAGGIFTEDKFGVNASVIGQLISYFVQATASTTSPRSAQSTMAEIWYAAQVAIVGGAPAPPPVSSVPIFVRWCITIPPFGSPGAPLFARRVVLQAIQIGSGASLDTATLHAMDQNGLQVMESMELPVDPLQLAQAIDVGQANLGGQTMELCGTGRVVIQGVSVQYTAKPDSRVPAFV